MKRTNRVSQSNLSTTTTTAPTPQPDDVAAVVASVRNMKGALPLLKEIKLNPQAAQILARGAKKFAEKFGLTGPQSEAAFVTVALSEFCDATKKHPSLLDAPTDALVPELSEDDIDYEFDIQPGSHKTDTVLLVKGDRVFLASRSMSKPNPKDWPLRDIHETTIAAACKWYVERQPSSEGAWGNLAKLVTLLAAQRN